MLIEIIKIVGLWLLINIGFIIIVFALTLVGSAIIAKRNKDDFSIIKDSKIEDFSNIMVGISALILKVINLIYILWALITIISLIP